METLTNPMNDEKQNRPLPTSPEENAPVDATPEPPVAEAPAMNETPAEEAVPEEKEEVLPAEESAAAPEEQPVAAGETDPAPAEEAEPATAEEAEPEPAPAEEEPAAPAEEASEEKEDFSHKIYASKEELLQRLRDITSSDEVPTKEESDHLKAAFYKMHAAEREAEEKAYLAQGGDPEKFQYRPDEAEEEFKTRMQVIKERRAKHFQLQEEEKQENLKKKLDIIDQIKEMVTSPEEANRNFQKFKALQQQWKEIKAVPAEKANELWRNYHLYVEQVYDLLKLNNEAREYDFKKNLEIKEKLCEAAEKLADEEDVVSAFHRLQELHQQFRETGPVAKALREDIWQRFKAASTVVNKRHQQHFEQLRAHEDENLERKTALCEQAEEIAAQQCKGAGDWDKLTQRMLALQQEWKTIGFAPQKMNVKIFERFRKACDTFFGNKAAYFKDMKQRFAENAAKKKALLEQAQALMDDTSWKETADKLVALQKEWKTVGAVPKKMGDQLWNDFQAACNHFFEARKAAGGDPRGAERDNLKKKRGIIAQLKEMAENAQDAAEEKVQALVEEYNAVGHVPFRDKDKVYNEFRDTLRQVEEKLGISVNSRQLERFKSGLRDMARKGGDAVDNERSRLMHRYDQLRQEIQTYENNLGFLNAASKKGNSLVEEMNKKVQKLKDEYKLVYDKIKAIDSATPPEEEEQA